MTLVILVLAVVFGNQHKTLAIADYGSLSVATSYQISAEPANTITPAMRSLHYKAGQDIVWQPVTIHNGLRTAVLWDIKYAPIVRSSYYWVAENTRATDGYGNYILCSPPPDGMQNWITVHERLPLKVEPGQTKEVLITLEVPENMELPDIWEFRLRYENLSQGGNVLISYDQIWQINSS